MKATIDFDDALYRRLKMEAARRGRTVRDLVAEGVRRVLDSPAEAPPPALGTERPSWVGSLRRYAPNAGGVHDMDAVRENIARAREAERG